MHVEQLAREIQARGLKDLRGNKTPESSGAGAGPRRLWLHALAAAAAAAALAAA